MLSKRMMVAAVVVLVACSAVLGADLGKARKLLAIGDYAAALAELDAAVKVDPENVDARLLMARVFAECAIELKMPGQIEVGRSNRERATYQLDILVKLGKKGKGALLKAIEGGDAKLAPIAIQVAGKNRLAEAVGPMVKLLKGGKAGAPLVSTALYALAQIKTREAVDAIRQRLDKEKDPQAHRRLAAMYVGCLDDDALLKLAGKTKDPDVLQQLAYRRDGRR